MSKDSALRVLMALVLGIMLIAAGLSGRPGSIVGAIVDPNNMGEISS
jgi:hypothetical protein